MFRAAAKNVNFGMSPHVDSASLGKRGTVFGALSAHSIQNGPLSGAAVEKDVASEAQNAPAPGGPGASQTFVFQVFLKNETRLGSASRKISKSYVGPKVLKLPLAPKGTHFRQRFLL